MNKLFIRTKDYIFMIIILLLLLFLYATFNNNSIENKNDNTYAVSTPIVSTSGYWIDSGRRGSSFGGGSGTSTSPYIISTAQQLAYLSYKVYNGTSYLGKYFKQTADINLSSYYWQPIGSFYNRSGISSGVANFKGNYDGQGYVVSGVITKAGTGNAYCHQGFFGYVNDGTISNVILKDSYIRGYEHVGGIAGLITSSNVIGCSYAGTVEGYIRVGGIVGNSNKGLIDQCYNEGQIKGLTHSESGTAVGGIVGRVNGSVTISNCYNTGTVKNNKNQAGGIVGYIDDTSSVSVLIYNCFNRGSVSASVLPAGIVGSISNTGNTTKIYNCYNIGAISGSTEHGIVAWAKRNCTLNSCYYVSGSGNPLGTNGNSSKLTTLASEAKNTSFYTSASRWYSSYKWDMNNIWGLSSSINNGYPFLKVFNKILTANANGGIITNAPGWIIEGVEVTKRLSTNENYGTLPSVSRTGYTLRGWYTSSSGGNVVSSSTKMGAVDTTIYAQWRANNYSISYSLGIGSWGSNPKYTTNTQFDRAFEVSNPVAPTGYTFTGWTAGGANFNSTTARYGSGSNSCNYTWNGSTLVKTNHFFKNLASADNGSVTMTANYTANVYTITLDKGSGSGGTSTIYMKYNTGWYLNISATGSPITSITKPTPPTGYNFLGYYTEPNGEGNLIINSAGKIVASNTYTASNDTLYAYYTPKINKVVYNAQGGTIEDSTIVNSNGEYYDLVEYGQAYRAKRNLYNASRSSLNYDSSKMDFTLNNGVYTLKTKSTISSMIWANFFQSYTGQYSQGVYTVVIEVTSVSMTSGQFSISLTSPYDVGSTPVDISAGTVTTGGVSSAKTYFLTMDVRDCSTVAPEYDFRSYVTIPSGVQGQISFRISVIPGKITENDYKYVSYMQTITTLKMPGAVKTGYDFRGWKTSSSGGTQINANTIYSINGNTKIYAQWQETWYKYKTTPTGKGTQLDPYIIDSAGDLAYIASQVAIGKDLTVYCRQTAPIDLSAHNWYPIGTYKYAFSGSYDGQAYQIMGLKTAATVNESNSSTVGSYVGLFGNTSGAKLSNIYVKDALIKGHTYVGGIVGYASGSTTLSNCGYSGNTSNNNIDITAVANSGALIGYSASSTVKITDCIVFNTKLTKLDSGSATISSTVHVLNGARGYTGSSFDNWVYISGMPTPLPKGLSWLAESIDLDTATINSLIKTWAS